MLSAMAGNVLGLIGGGWLAETYGWRVAFLVSGAPGLLLVMLVLVTVREPRLLLPPVPAGDREPLSATVRVLMGKPSYRYLVGAMILYWMMAYGALIFTPSFLVRVHGMSLSGAGSLYGGVSAIGAVLGTLVGGMAADRLARRDPAWLGRLPGIMLILMVPVYQAAYLAPTLPLAGALLLLGTVGLTGAIPAMFAALQMICGGRRRATAVALAFFFANAIGLVLGPLLSGMLSDRLAAGLGAAQGLRWALVVVVLSFGPAGLLLLRAGRHLGADAER
jgi:MFS family permease